MTPAGTSLDPRPELEEHITSYASAEDGSLSHAGALVFFDGGLERLDVVRAAARAALAHPELRERPARLPLAADVLAWSRDPSFRPSKQVHVVELDDAGDDAALARAVAHVWSRALPSDRPPWELTAFSDRHGLGTAVLVKAHHALVDAHGPSALAAILLGTPPDALPRSSPRVPQRRQRPTALPTLLRAAAAIADEGARRSRMLAAEVREILRPGVALARTREVGRILEAAGTLLSSPAPETPWNGTLGSERRVAWLALSRDVLRGVADAFGGGWEDAWLAIVADALGRNLRHRGRATTGLTLLAYVPGDDHGHGAAVLSSAAAHATARLVGLPVDEMSPAARHASIVRGRAEPLAAARGSGLEQLARMSHRLPAPLQTLLGSLCYQAANTVLVDETVAAGRLQLAGREATAIAPLAALPWHVGLAIAALDWHDAKLVVGITADATLVPDVSDVVRTLHDAYVELAAAAGVPPVDPGHVGRTR